MDKTTNNWIVTQSNETGCFAVVDISNHEITIIAQLGRTEQDRKNAVLISAAPTLLSQLHKLANSDTEHDALKVLCELASEGVSP